MACALWQMDDNADTWRRAGMLKTALTRKPSEYFTKHVFCSFIRDPLVGQMLNVLPVDNLMFGSDFPHGVTTWPQTKRTLEETFAGASPALRRKVLVETPARFFGLDPERAITATPN
jgi:predicted TIM-barrel fold metal-dependent hydrolase